MASDTSTACCLGLKRFSRTPFQSAESTCQHDVAVYTLYRHTCSSLIFLLLFSPLLQADPGVVECLENHVHNLETGDLVAFKEVVGMEAINGSTHSITGTYLYTHHTYTRTNRYTNSN